MSISIGEQVFEGPFVNAQELKNDPGVFAVIVAKGDKGSLIDIGESNSVGECVACHPDQARWQAFSSEGQICYAVLFTPELDEQERKSIELDIRRKFAENG